MFQILNYKAVNKNTLVAVFSVKIQKWGDFIIREIAYFKKGNQRWITFPSKTYEKDGKTKYYPYLAFENSSMMSKFQEKVMECLEEYLKVPQNNSLEENNAPPF